VWIDQRQTIQDVCSSIEFIVYLRLTRTCLIDQWELVVESGVSMVASTLERRNRFGDLEDLIVASLRSIVTSKTLLLQKTRLRVVAETPSSTTASLSTWWWCFGVTYSLATGTATWSRLITGHRFRARRFCVLTCSDHSSTPMTISADDLWSWLL